MASPEAEARKTIDAALQAAGWDLQDPKPVNLYAARGVAVREFPMAPGHGEADYLLFVDQKACGAVEAKKAGQTLTGVEVQAVLEGLPAKALRRHSPTILGRGSTKSEFVHNQAHRGAFPSVERTAPHRGRG